MTYLVVILDGLEKKWRRIFLSQNSCLFTVPVVKDQFYPGSKRESRKHSQSPTVPVTYSMKCSHGRTSNTLGEDFQKLRLCPLFVHLHSPRVCRCNLRSLSSSLAVLTLNFGIQSCISTRVDILYFWFACFIFRHSYSIILQLTPVSTSDFWLFHGIFSFWKKH